MRSMTKPPGDPTGQRGLLTVEHVAAELSTDTLAVKRLIARGRLPATRLGDGREWRVSEDALQQYVTRGAIDFNPPAFNANWFATDDVANANAFFDAAKEAMREQVLPELPASMVPRKGLGDSVDIEVTLTGKVDALLKQTVPHGMRLAGAEPDSRNWREIYLVEQLRSAARVVLGRDRKAGLPLEKLYAGPDEYDRIVKAAEASALGKRIPLRQQYTIDSRVINVWYILNHSQLAQAGVMDRVRQAAF